jgi:hypothetical protein
VVNQTAAAEVELAEKGGEGQAVQQSEAAGDENLASPDHGPDRVDGRHQHGQRDPALDQPGGQVDPAHSAQCPCDRVADGEGRHHVDDAPAGTGDVRSPYPPSSTGHQRSWEQQHDEEQTMVAAAGRCGAGRGGSRQ